MQRLHRKSSFGGATTLMTIGGTILGLCASVLAIDTAFYFNCQNQLQTATDAAALAGGQAMFLGRDAAEEAALEMLEANSINGMPLTSDDVEFEAGSANFKLKAKKTVPTIMAKLLCGLAGKNPGRLVDGQPVDDSDGDGNVDATDGCSYMTVYAGSQAVGAPRDTVLVFDTSSSMDDLGYGQPFRDVRSAAKAFVDMVVEMENENPNSIDKVALVKFDQSSKLVRTFTSTQDSPGLNRIKNDIDSLKLYTGSGWNTNYESGLKVALDEIQARARPSAHKTIIFFTDGEPNLPGGSTDINNCLYYKSKNKNSQAKTCAQTYINYMTSKTNTQIERAADMDVTIHTIQISDAEAGGSLETFQYLLGNNRWEPGLLDSMADETSGKQYEAESADGEAILEIFQEVAKIVHMKLAPYSAN